jgi:hypothetical protein
MNDYFDFPAERSLLPPGDLAATHFYYFLLRADRQKLQALCDRVFNDRAGGELAYRALGFVALAFTHVERLTCADPVRGSICYKDIALWVPVWGGKTRPLCLFPPFIFVDDASTMVTGREVFGLPKQMGRFQMPLEPDDLAQAPQPPFRAEVVGTVTPDGPNDWRTLLTIEQVGNEVSDDHHSFFAAIARLAGAGELASLSVPSWLSHLTEVPTLGLKQLRDNADPRRAAFQAVVEAPLRPELIGRPRFFFDAFDLTLMNVPSHPVAEVLGLPADRQRVPLTVYFQATMHMDAGSVVWSQR